MDYWYQLMIKVPRRAQNVRWMRIFVVARTGVSTMQMLFRSRPLIIFTLNHYVLYLSSFWADSQPILLATCKVRLDRCSDVLRCHEFFSPAVRVWPKFRHMMHVCRGYCPLDTPADQSSRPGQELVENVRRRAVERARPSCIFLAPARLPYKLTPP